MIRDALSVVFAGSGGSGAMAAGELLVRAAAEAGYYATMNRLFGPQVIGGEAASLIQISVQPVTYVPERYDIFVALDWERVDQFAPEIPLDADSIILSDPASGPIPASIAKAKAKNIALIMNVSGAKSSGRHRGGSKTVSYTHLTLPTKA